MISTQVFVAAVGMFVTLAAVTDLHTRRIPNHLTVPAALLGLLYHSFSPAGWGPWVSLAGFGVGFSLLLLPWLLGGGGMGDVKLLAALGAWLGTECLLITFVISCLFAAAMAVIVLLYWTTQKGIARARERYLGSRRPTRKSPPKQPARVLPFAVPVALSTCIVLTWLVFRGVV